jgi:outer membrane protein assembly factor BamB
MSGGGGFLTVNRNQDNHAEVSVYRLDTLDELWRADNTYGYAFACGSAMCLNGQNGLVAYDPGTGRERWRLGTSANGWIAGPDRLIVEEAENGGENAALAIVDATTGKPVGESLRGQPVWTTTPGGQVLVLRSTGQPPNRTSVTRWDLRTGRTTLLGSLDLMAGQRCQAVPGYLACQRAHDYQVTATGR